MQKITPIGDLYRPFDRARQRSKTSLAVRNRLQVALRVGDQPFTATGDRRFVFNGRQRIMQRHARGMMVEYIATGDG